MRPQVCDDGVLGLELVMANSLEFLLLGIFKGWQRCSPVIGSLGDTIANAKRKSIIS
jgi:hypothetical protein